MILNDLLNNHRLGESLLDALGHDGLGSAVKQLLLAVAERVGNHVTGSVSDAGVRLPVVVAGPLLARTEVAVSLLVHFFSFAPLLHGACSRVEDILGVGGGMRGHTEAMVLLGGDLLGPLVATLVRLAEGLAHGRGILTLLSVIEFVSESIQVLGLDDHVDGVSTHGLLAESVGLGEIGLANLKAGMHHDLTRIHVVGLTELADVRGSSEVSSGLVAVGVLADGHVGVVAAS